MCVLVATVNGPEIYSDVHGADIRRLWILETPKVIDTARIRAIRDGIWSEAYAATKGDDWNGSMLVCGEPHWLTNEEKAAHEERSHDYRQQDPWREPIVRIIKGHNEVQIADVLRTMGIAVKDQSRRESLRAAKVLRSLRCTESRGVMREEAKVNVWNVPEELAALPKEKFPSLR